MRNHLPSTYHSRHTYSLSEYLETPRRGHAAIPGLALSSGYIITSTKTQLFAIHVIKRTGKVSEPPKFSTILCMYLASLISCYRHVSFYQIPISLTNALFLKLRVTMTKLYGKLKSFLNMENVELNFMTLFIS